jgi:hypothetical protein
VKSHTCLKLLIALAGVLGTMTPVRAASVIDQQQPTIDISVGALAIGGDSTQKLAQIVTTGAAGFLTAVRLPIVCETGSSLVVEIQQVASGVPNGVVMTSQTFPGGSLSPDAAFKDLVFSAPVSFAVGEQFAIVLKSSGTCAALQGPVGDTYAPGNLYFDALPNRPGWVCVCTFAGARFDLPFQTLVESFCTPPAVTGALVNPATILPPNYTIADVKVNYTAASSCPASCTLNITSNEAPNGISDGHVSHDWLVINPHRVWLRAERTSTGKGRLYSVTIACTNSAGQSTTAGINVTVPDDGGK